MTKQPIILGICMIILIICSCTDKGPKFCQNEIGYNPIDEDFKEEKIDMDGDGELDFEIRYSSGFRNDWITGCPYTTIDTYDIFLNPLGGNCVLVPTGNFQSSHVTTPFPVKNDSQIINVEGDRFWKEGGIRVANILLSSRTNCEWPRSWSRNWENEDQIKIGLKYFTSGVEFLGYLRISLDLCTGEVIIHENATF